MVYRPPDSVIEHRLTRAFPAERLRALARATGLVERRRKLDAAALFWALTLGFAVGGDRSIEAFRQSYLQCVGGELSLTYAPFHGWFAESLTAFLREVLDHALGDLSQSTDCLDGRFARFRDVLIPDTTVVALYQSLIESFPGYGDDHAGAKLHVVESVSTGLPTQFSITDARTHESTRLSTGQWLTGSLLLYDQGFFDYRTMDLIDANKGWFVTRLKPNANPRIVEELRDWRGNTVSLTGEKLHAVLDDLHRDVIDVRAEVSFRRRSYNGSRSGAIRTFRVVGVWNEEAEKYHFYVTNLPVADYSASDIAQLYRARWEVELLFKELKSTYNLDQIPTSNSIAVEALILVALISLVVSRVLLDLLREIVDGDAAGDDGDDPSRIPRLRWSRVFSRYGGLILQRVAQYHGYDPPEKNLLELLLAAAIDPNPHRPSLIEDVQHGAFVRELA
ncbi:IS4 family transposase [Natrialba aegyptia]|uniref:Transposase (ISH5) n=1 Tax=Natrialba aegyptia DSM 13077 TaxID=1227491 RepID=M0APS9_9EURY|nr:IS4 family transposase [Natrialba aegyptia]ELY99942.1 transposase (ISH5) [Natrialba aegyptia DSM 13077]